MNKKYILKNNEGWKEVLVLSLTESERASMKNVYIGNDTEYEALKAKINSSAYADVPANVLSILNSKLEEINSEAPEGVEYSILGGVAYDNNGEYTYAINVKKNGVISRIDR